MASLSHSSQALAGLVALSGSTNPNAHSPSSSSSSSSSSSDKQQVMFEYPESSGGSTAQQTLYSLKEATARPRAYTEGDAYEIFQSFSRPRSNTLSDSDAVGALLSFSSEKGGNNDSRSASPFGGRKMNKEDESTAFYIPRARAMSDMSHAVLSMGKLEMEGGRGGGGRGSGSRGISSNGGKGKSKSNDARGRSNSNDSSSSSSSSSSGGGGGGGSSGTHQFPVYRRKVNIGIYSPAARRDRLRRFMQKRKKRIWQKRVKYDVRKNFADSRLRFKGRFVKKEDEELMRAAMEIC